MTPESLQGKEVQQSTQECELCFGEKVWNGKPCKECDGKGVWYHISYANINFNCPNCGNIHSDEEDKYLDRCNKNKNGCTRVICERCGERFMMTYDMMGNAIGFEMNRTKN